MAHFQPKISEELLAKVNAILNPSSGEEACKAAGIDIEEYSEFASYTIECIFKGEVNGEPFELSPMLINRLVIEQDFENHYTNHIDLNVSMLINNLLTLYDGYQDLKCDLILRHTHPTSAETKDEPVHILSNYKVLFKDKEDLRKKMPKKSLIPDDEGEYSVEQQGSYMDVSFQLIEDVVYKLRVKEFSFQMPDSTVKDAILYIATISGIESVMFVEPDNTETIENLVVPPMCTFKSAIEHIQLTYGVYYKGLGYYYDEGVLYVYPKYETVPSVPIPGCALGNVNNIYFIGAEKFPGMEINHAVDKEGSVHVVLNHNVNNTDMVDMGIENFGTGIMLAQSKRMIDQWRTVLEPHGGNARIGINPLNVLRTPNVILTALSECERKKIGIDPSVSIIKYALNDNNNYHKLTPMNSYKRTMATTTWDNAVPFTFKPGFKIMWHYDGENSEARDHEEQVSEQSSMYTTKPGVVNSVTYIFQLGSRVGTTNIFRCTANMSVYLEMDTTEVKGGSGSSSNIGTATSNRDIGGGSASTLVNVRLSDSACPIMAHYKHLESADPSTLDEADKNTLRMYRQRLGITE
jgi:hypothetical protein